MSTGAQGNGLTDPAAYTARDTTYSPGSQVPSAMLNAHQDGIIDTSTAVDALAAKVSPIRTATTNQSDSPAPTTYGGVEVVVERSTNGTTAVVIDSSIDWRDRYVVVVFRVEESDISTVGLVPGGGSDDDISYQIDDAGATHGLFYTQEGQDGTVSTSCFQWVPATMTDAVRIFARDSDGALCIIKNGTANNEYMVAGFFRASPVQNHY